MSSAPYRNLEEDHISVDSAGSQGDGAKFSSQTRDGGKEYNVEVVGMGGFSSSGLSRNSLDGLKYSKKCLVSILVIILLAFILIIFVAIISHGSKAGGGGSKVESFFPWKNIRLPTDVEPQEYNIFLNPDLSKGTVMGTVSIVLQATGETDFIVIHAKNMTLADVKLRKINSNSQRIDSSSVQVKPPIMSTALEAAYLALDKNLEKDSQYNLTITFSYNLTESLSGFYISKYIENDVTKVIGSTQMEPVDARRAFPCFDEPQLKANFSLKIVHDKNTDVVLFNTPNISTESFASNKLITSFETTVSMSTYLVAFVICDFTSVSNVTSSGTEIAVYSRREQADQMNLALDAMKEIIPFYEEFFDIGYPLAKQDMVAIPNFEAGAMENWGLILYRESTLLYKEGVTKSLQKQFVVIVIAHELAHQWFGNLVTMKWWNDLWLNEGFASFVEYLGTDHYMPEWKMMDQFILETTQVALARDALSESHPISVEIRDPSEIGARFDSITYDKGASIIRMIHDYLGRDVFKVGLQRYLKLHAYGNTETADLWEALRKAAKDSGNEVDVKDLMDYWTLQMGYPVVTLRKDKSKVHVTQERFLLEPEARPNSTYKSQYNYKWKIPLTYTYYTGPNIKRGATLVLPDQETIITVPEDIAWIKGNSNQSGFYRVNYDRGNWNALTDVLLKNHGEIPPADRANLIDDAFHLHRANKLEMEVPFNMLAYLQHEREYVPLVTAMDNLNYIRKVLLFHKVYDNFTIYLEKIFNPVLLNLTMEDKGNHLEKLLRESLVKFLLDNGHSQTLQWAADNFASYRNGESPVGVNLAPIMKCGGVKAGLEDDWNFVWEKFKSNTIASETNVLLKALTCTRDPAILSWLLFESLEDRFIRSQDAITVMSYVLDNPVGANIAVNFVMEQWDQLKEKFGSNLFALRRLIPRMVSWISAKVQAFHVIEFLDSKYDEVPAGMQTVILQAIEHLQINFEFVETNAKTWEQWLAKKLES